MKPRSNSKMASGTSTLNKAAQVKVMEEPTIPTGAERSRETDRKSLGTEGKGQMYKTSQFTF